MAPVARPLEIRPHFGYTSAPEPVWLEGVSEFSDS